MLVEASESKPSQLRDLVFVVVGVSVRLVKKCDMRRTSDRAKKKVLFASSTWLLRGSF